MPTLDAARLQAIVVCEPVCGDSLRSVGGITLLERILRQLSELGAVAHILVIKPEALSLPPPSSRVRKNVSYRKASGVNAWEMLREARGELDEQFVVVSAEYLIDQRLLAWLAAQSQDVMLGKREDAPEPVARLSRIALNAVSPQEAGIRTVTIGSLPSSWEEMHGEVPLHLHRVTNSSDAEAGWQILLDHVQRRTLELPGYYFDPPFENLIVRRLAGTPVTANHVTLVTTLLGFAVAALYFTGWLRVGAVLAILVEVLDGVDGKLARVTRTTSRAGELEHVADFFYENACYLALGSYLSSSGFAHAWIAAVLMVLFDLSDTLAYALMDVRWGLSLDNVSPLLARFRLVAGRRNIYNWLFLAGFFLGIPAQAFYIAAAWAGITAAIHTAWVIFETRTRSRALLSSD